METAEEKAARLNGTTQKDPHGPLSFRHFLLGAIAIFFYVGIEVGIPNIANLYMTGDPTVGPAVAGVVVGAYWFLMMCGRLIGGAIGNKVSSKAMMLSVSSLALLFVLCIMFLPKSVTVNVFGTALPVNMLFVALCGLCTSVMWGAIFNLSVEGLGKYTPMASGIFMTLVCGGGILPALQGWVADLTDYMTSYWIIIFALAYLIYYALIGSNNVNRDIKVD